MSRTISAIFDAGVFRPLEPVVLAEGTQVEIQFSPATQSSSSELAAEALARQQLDIEKMVTEIENLPIEEWPCKTFCVTPPGHVIC